MTRDSASRGAWPFEGDRPLDLGTLLIALLLAGLAVRAVIAGLFWQTGFQTDVNAFTAWAMRLADVGPGGFYEASYFADYPPGYLYVLWLLGSIGASFQALLGIDITAGLVKVPAILADVGVAAMLFVLARRFLDARVGIAAVALYLFNPGVIFDSSVWGQIDSVGTLVLLGTLYALARGWTEAAAFGAALALLVKFQFGFLIPLVAVVGLKRHLTGRSADPLLPVGRDPLRVLTSLAVGLGAVTLLILPFGMTLYAPMAGGAPRGLLGILPEADPTTSLVGKFVEAANTYEGLSINAFNLWRLLGTWIDPGRLVGATGQWWGDDTQVLGSLGSFAVTWQVIGAGLFLAVAGVALWLAWRRDHPRGILLAALVLAVAFFVLPTRVHERYLFPALAIGALLAPLGWRWAAAYVALSASFFLNIYHVYTIDWSYTGRIINPGMGGDPMRRDPLLAQTLLSPPGGTGLLEIGGIAVVSFVSVAVMAWLLVEAVRLGRSPLLAWSSTRAHARPERATAATGVEGDAGSGPAADERRGLRLGWASFAWLRRDPGDPYHREPPRRLDRLDLLIVSALVLAAILFRVWRLDVPRHMHFDEVYHARSATEWLANWRNGWSRDVYEWTHPMLAKYLIAAGIVVADPNRVVDAMPMSGPAPALAVAPQRSSIGQDRSIVFAANGSTVDARDALTGEELATWSADGPVGALLFDPDNDRLLVGLLSSGTVTTHELASWRAQPDPRGPPATQVGIATGLEAVHEIVAPEDEPLLLFRGPDGVATAERVTGAPLAAADVLAGGIAYLPGVAATDETEEAPGQVVITDPQAIAVRLLDATSLQPVSAPTGSERPLPDVPVGPILAVGRGEDRQLWVPVSGLPASDEHAELDGGLVVFDHRGREVGTAPLPGEPRLIVHQPVANIVYVAGTDADSGEPALWAVEPHGEARRDTTIGFSAFDATPLPGSPIAMAVDATERHPADDHERLLVATASADGASLVAIDAGSNAFAWRFGGVIFGALLAGLVYLLAATMFQRRRIAVLAGLFVAFDAMSYVMSRIAMNDIFVATFIVAAYLVFWQVWSGRWARSAWWALPATGVLIGLAAASKWVGFYALAALLVLVLARSDLGRILIVAGLAFGLFAAAIGAPWPFGLALAVALGVAMLVVLRERVRIGLDDLMGLAGSGVVLGGVGLALYLGAQQVEGRSPRNAVEYLFGLLAQGAQAGWPALLMVGVAAVLLAWRAVVSLRDPDSDRRWYQPGELAGFAWPWVGASLVIVPLVVYGLTYLPYLALGHSFAGADSGPGYGWTLDELHAQMFGYHFGLQSGHPASSPWWSWPLDLKTVWFYSSPVYDGGLQAMIFNGGNPLFFWAGVPAVAFAGVMAWRRRSLALLLLVVAFALQWLPWTRIERASFQYHYLTALPFALVAVAYVVDEALRTWTWRPFAIAFLVLAVVSGILIFPLGAAIAMPDWYITAARGLPPWNYAFQFPDPPTGDRGDLLAASAGQLIAGVVAAIAAVAVSLRFRLRLPGDPDEPMGPSPARPEYDPG